MLFRFSGDTRVNNACKRWLNRGGKAIWTYTHAWATINRKEWSSVSILASVDKIEDIAKARLMGYAPAIAISEHPSNKKFSVKGTSTEFIPCPAQTKDIKCDQCQLCLKADYLFKNNLGIAFAAHGVAKRKIKLKVI